MSNISGSDWFRNVSNKVNNSTLQSGSEPKKYNAIVVENRKMSDGPYVRFMPTDLIPLGEGLIKDNPINIKRSFKTYDGKRISAKGTTNNNLVARYFSSDSTRKSVPDVQRGERIKVWQMGDSDMWWWEPTNLDSMTKRRLETVIDSVNADKPYGPDSNEHSPNNTYFMEKSSHNKTVTIHTSKANGEVAAYDIQINAGQGVIVIKDDQNNYIELDTTESRITLNNSCQTKVELRQNDIYVHCNEKYTEEVGTDKTSTVGANDTQTVKGNRNVTINGNCTVNINGNANVTVGGNTVLDCPDTTITGNTKIGGTLAVAGTFTAPGMSASSGACNISTPTTVEKQLKVSGPVKLSGGTSSGVIHGSYIDT